MHLVAVAKLATPLDVEALALAADLGITAYEARLKLAGGLPVVVMTAPDAAQAGLLVEKLRARGHGVLTCDAADAVPAEAMVSLRRFTFERDGVAATDVPGALLPYADVLALFRAQHQTRSETLRETSTKQFSAGRALLSGGLLVTKSVTREGKNVSAESEQVCYVFRASGAVPWLLRERGTQYAGLGAEVAPSSAQNFLATIARLRKLAPGAVYDERLMKAHKAPSTPTRTRGEGSETLAVSSASGVDLLAHLLALSLHGGASSAAP